MLSEQQLQTFRRDGHVTVEDVFDSTVITQARRDVETWADEFLREMRDDQKTWYLERETSQPGTLRKLDNPVFHRPFFRDLARSPNLVSSVEQLIGSGVCVFFSQVFMKPAGGGGPKPIHQDNFYFGPDDPDATLTVWIAIDDATTDNGCLFYGDGSHRLPVISHVAPPGEPFNLQVPETEAAKFIMTAAPVRAGGVSFHHGNTLHQSSANLSGKSRRAIAMHFLRNNALLQHPTLKYDKAVRVSITAD
ncbi:MAG: phytanoyl-CoA dioxygenase family protein [Planctomycetaceae bacterium]|nr:phytanoyl-CoA dioxygenase family protein [Planctomycetaceae bacterium]